MKGFILTTEELEILRSARQHRNGAPPSKMNRPIT